VSASADQPGVDVVRVRRARAERLASIGRNGGYLVYLLAIVLFIVGFVVGFSGPLAAVIIACLIVGSFLLAPAIVVGYAVKAAERDDREHGR